MTFQSITRKSQKLRDSAKGEECTLQIFPYCDNNPETVVLCHLTSAINSGMGMKPHDFFAVYGCASCHKIIDGQVGVGLHLSELLSIKINALYRTQLRMFEKELIKL